jgi:uncharacterized protein YggE
MSRKLCSYVVAVLVAGSGNAAAQTSGPPPFSIRVTDEATVSVKPDEAQIDVGVTTKAETSESAARENARQTRAVVEALRAGTGPGATVETVSYTLTPDLRYPREGGEPTIAGYTATNIVRVTLHDLSRVGDVVDLASKAGANRIHRINFTLQDERAARARALRMAADNAKARAEILAAALGVKIVRVLSATTGGEAPVRPFDAAALRAQDADTPTPIHPGTIDVHANVTLIVEITGAAQAAERVR